MIQILRRTRAPLLAGRVIRPVGMSLYRPYSIYEKYKEKLEKRARDQNKTIEDLLKETKEHKKPEIYDPLRLVEKAHQKQAKKTEQPEAEDSIAQEEPKPSPGKTESGASKQNLDSFIDVDKLKLHDTKQIELIWKARFVDKTNDFCGSLNADTFSRLYVNARRYPTFVLPLPHEKEGVELHYVQWSFTEAETIHCLITSLAEYKLHGEFASPHTTILIHTDLLASKGLALMNAIVQTNKVPLHDAVLLALNLQRFYTAKGDSSHSVAKLQLLKEFNTGDANFSVDKLIEAAETLD